MLRTAPNRPLVEALDTRRLCAAGSSDTSGGSIVITRTTTTDSFTATVGRALMSFDDGVLKVFGTSNADQITPVISHGRLSFETLIRYPSTGVITINDRPIINFQDSALAPATTLTDAQLPKLSDVKKIVIDCGEGADTVLLGDLAIDTEVHGGNGNDSITGGTGNDTLFGDAGNDSITDARGNSLLAGGRGKDVLTASGGLATLLGQAGDDLLYSLRAENVVNGGAGDDATYLRYAPDAIAGVERDIRSSPLAYTPITTVAPFSKITLRRNGRGLAVDASVTVATGGWGVDWDLLKNSSGNVEVNATLFRPRGGTSQGFAALTHTFELGQNLSPRSVGVTFSGAGGGVSGKVLVTPAFQSKTFRSNSGDDDVTFDPSEVTIA